MGKPYLSFIVPTYNQQKDLLRKCIESIAACSKYEKEILIIDDGSKKEIADYCDELAEEFKATVHHIPNGGLPNARNVGISKASGEWIAFVDSDDWLVAEEYAKLELEKYEEDIILFNSVQVYTTGEKKIISVPDIPEGHVTESGKKYLQLEILADGYKENRSMGLLMTAYTKVFRKKIFDEYGLSFEPRLSIAEDTNFTMSYIIRDDISIYYLDIYPYMRLVNMNSMMHSYVPNIVKNDKVFTDSLDRFFGSNTDPDIKEALTKRYCLCALGILMFDMANPKNPKPFKTRVAECKEVMRKEPYRTAIKEAQLSRFGKRNKLRLILLRMKMESLAIRVK